MVVDPSPRLHRRICASVAVCDIALVAAILAVHRVHPVNVPAAGHTDTSALIGWLGTFSAIFIFGCYGITIKTPAVRDAKVDSMIFQVYFTVGVAASSMLIWAVAGGTNDPMISPLGFVFAAIWIVQQVFAFNAVQLVGYAVGPAIWAGLTMAVSFAWGVAFFGHQPVSWPGSVLAVTLLVVGVCLAAASGSDTARRSAECRGRRLSREGAVADDARQVLTDTSGQSAASQDALRTLLGYGCAVMVGLLNGTLMVPVTCFQSGSSILGIAGYSGALLPAIAFLPSLSLGILCMQVPAFLIYFARELGRCRVPHFHASVAAVPGLLTGAFWGMGNFAAMFATAYLGQTIGFPLTQTCIIVGGLWGVLYYGEIVGRLPLSLFATAVAIIIAGAVLDGRYG